MSGTHKDCVEYYKFIEMGYGNKDYDNRLLTFKGKLIGELEERKTFNIFNFNDFYRKHHKKTHRESKINDILSNQ